MTALWVFSPVLGFFFPHWFFPLWIFPPWVFSLGTFRCSWLVYRRKLIRIICPRHAPMALVPLPEQQLHLQRRARPPKSPPAPPLAGVGPTLGTQRREGDGTGRGRRMRSCQQGYNEGPGLGIVLHEGKKPNCGGRKTWQGNAEAAARHKSGVGGVGPDLLCGAGGREAGPPSRAHPALAASPAAAGAAPEPA